MTDPVSLSAKAIATLAFTKAFEKTVEKLTETAGDKIDQLRKKMRQTIWLKLRSHFNKVEPVLNGATQGKKADLEKVTDYLRVVMDEDSEFTAEVQALAQQIHAVKVQSDNSSMNQNNYDNGHASQIRVENRGTIGELHIKPHSS
ncbi:MAG: hypothetical protein F6K41_44995 [Symploca sp. SIO3E6]|nr:hypothetical protein [Caldora sp. SIO3E6]